MKGWALNETKYENATLLKVCHEKLASLPNSSVIGSGELPDDGGQHEIEVSCGYLFEYFGLGDLGTGIVLLFLSLFVLSFCLIMLVKVLNSIMQEQAAQIIKKSLNIESEGVLGYLSGYLAILIGAIITFCVQSSSVFTSTITPLVGIGLFPLEKAYPLTLGSNIGTTTTGILAALAADGSHLKDSLQIALCHLLFNITGILIFYPVPAMRWPIPMAKAMGRTTARYRWFAVFYLIFMFFLFPLYIFGLSLIGPVAIYLGFVPLFLLLVVVIVVNVVQNSWPEWLPDVLQDWEFLPEPLRSLDPYDRYVQVDRMNAKAYFLNILVTT